MENEKKIKEKILTLVQLLNKWNKEYFLDNNPSVSDLEYDQKLYELGELEKKYPQFVFPNSPTQNLGGYVDNRFKKVIHNQPMLSLSKAYSYDEIVHYIETLEKKVPLEDINFSIEPKIDGLSISLHYQNGFLVQALTRGNGIEGEDVTENVYTISVIPKIINYSKDLEVRGEVYLPKDNFNRINQELLNRGEKEFANPRNAASGTLRQLDQNIVKSRGLSALLYELVDPEKHNIKTQEEAINFMKNLGIPTNPFHKIVEIEDLEEEIENFAEVKNTFSYDADGLVIKLNNLKYWKPLGKTAKFPRHSIAFKYEVESAISTITAIKTTVGRTGKITYVASLEPVELNQTIVKAATLHNYNFIKSLNINIGDKVKIVKAGEIIPKVLENVSGKNSTNYRKATECPSCHSKLVEYEDNVDQFCINENCEDKIVNNIYHFASRESLNIVGLGLTTCYDLYHANLLKSIYDIFSLKDHKEAIKKLSRYGELKVNNLLKNIEKSKELPFNKVIFALGIKHLGARAAKLISRQYTCFIDILGDYELFKIQTIPNIGPKIIESFAEFLKEQENRKLLEFLDNTFEYQKAKVSNSTKLDNLTFVITGKLSQPREYYQELIEINGGKVSSSVSSKTSYLLIGEDAGSKFDKAQELKIKIINEQEFNNLIK